MKAGDTNFTGPVPEIYDRFMVPMIFEPYAKDMAVRVAALAPAQVLEVAAGSGVVTRALAPMLDVGAHYVVTDLNPAMLEQAKLRQPPDPRIEWAAADALKLPFEDGRFDAVCCQFGAMFFPDKVKGYAEARRVLKPAAPFIFNVWDSLAHNLVSATVWEAVLAQFPVDPPDFFSRVPHGYFDQGQIRADLAAAGFGEVSIETVTRESVSPAARDAATALCMGTPIRMEIVSRSPDGLAKVTDAAEAALRKRFGDGPIRAKIQALVVVAKG